MSCATAQEHSPGETRFALRVNEVGFPGVYGSSSAVEVLVAVRPGCERIDDVTQRSVADTVRIEVLGTRVGTECGEPELQRSRIMVARRWPFTVRVTQPDGTFLVRPSPTLPERPCPGPSEHVMMRRNIVAGESYALQVNRCASLTRPIEAIWTVLDTTIATVTSTSDSTALLHAHRIGSTELLVRTEYPSRHRVPLVVEPPGGP